MKTTARPRSRTWRIRSQHLRGLDDTEGRGGLVEQDHVLGPHGCPRDGDRLSLAAREGRDRHPEVLDHPDAELGEALRAVCAAHRGLVGQESEPADLAPEEHVRRRRRGRAPGRGPGRPSRCRVPRRRSGWRGRPASPSTSMVPESGSVHAGQALDERRLAGAVVADERGDLARPSPRRRHRAARGPGRTASPPIGPRAPGRAAPGWGPVPVRTRPDSGLPFTITFSLVLAGRVLDVCGVSVLWCGFTELPPRGGSDDAIRPRGAGTTAGARRCGSGHPVGQPLQRHAPRRSRRAASARTRPP